MADESEFLLSQIILSLSISAQRVCSDTYIRLEELSGFLFQGNHGDFVSQTGIVLVLGTTFCQIRDLSFLSTRIFQHLRNRSVAVSRNSQQLTFAKDL